MQSADKTILGQRSARKLRFLRSRLALLVSLGISMIAISTSALSSPSLSSSVGHSVPRSEPYVVTYPTVPGNAKSHFDQYFLNVLGLALNKAGVRYHLQSYQTPNFVESRSEFFLQQNRYNVHWLHTNPRREGNLIPVRIPLFKGLMGWRLFLIMQGEQHRFNKVTTLEQLLQLSAGVGHDWPDREILETNNFPLVTATSWYSLFQMQAIGRMDFFPRSVIEVWQELAQFNKLNLEVEQTIALQYKTAYYFFVCPNSPELAEVIERGLNKAIDDGSFEKLFLRFHGDMIQKANLKHRKVFTLPNPFTAFPSDEKYWFTP